MSETKVLDVDNFSKRTVQVKYPHVLLQELNATTPLVISILEKGDIPVIGMHNGTKKVICNISNSAYNIDKLLRTHSTIEYCKSESKVYTLKSILDYLDLLL